MKTNRSKGKRCLFAAALLTGCAAAPRDIPVHGVTLGHACSTVNTRQFIGQQASEESGKAILAASHAALLRWAPPGVMLTMDFRQDRVTVRTDPAGKISAISCG